MSETEQDYKQSESRFQREGSAQAQNIAAAVSDISERSVRLMQEEIELAKAEVAEKVNSLVRGTVRGVAAGVFLIGALFLLLEGFSWLAWYLLPVGGTEFFWGFFFVAGVLILFAVLAGSFAARAMRAGAPPVPSMALEEARLIRETVNPTPGAEAPAPVGAPGTVPGWDPVPTDAAAGAHEQGPGASSEEKPGGETDAS